MIARAVAALRDGPESVTDMVAVAALFSVALISLVVAIDLWSA